MNPTCPVCGAKLSLEPCLGSFEYLCPRRDDGCHFVERTSDRTFTNCNFSFYNGGLPCSTMAYITNETIEQTPSFRDPLPSEIRGEE